MGIDRNKGIGCSELAAIMSLSRWDTPLSVFARKTGRVPEKDLSDFEAVAIGTELESFVAKKFEKKTGIKLRVDNRTFTHPDMPYFYGHIDRLVLNEDAVFEAKTCSAYKLKEWEGEEIPQEYILQLMGYLGLTKRKKGYIACLIGGQKFLWKEIHFDEQLWKKIEESVKTFWEEFVQKDVAPMAQASDNEFLQAMFPTSEPVTVQLDDTFDYLIEERAGAIEAKKEAESACKEIEAKIKQALGSAEMGETKRYKVSWKTINKKAFSVPETSFRTMRCTEKKELTETER